MQHTDNLHTYKFSKHWHANHKLLDHATKTN